MIVPETLSIMEDSSTLTLNVVALTKMSDTIRKLQKCHSHNRSATDRSVGRFTLQICREIYTTDLSGDLHYRFVGKISKKSR